MFPSRLARHRATTLRTLPLSVLVALLACGGESPTGPAAAITVTPPSALLPVGGSITLDATVTNKAGEPVDTLAVFWSSSDTTIATVSPDGVVTGRRAGEVRIAATSFGRSAVATVRVSNIASAPPPQTAPPPSSPPQAPPSNAVATVTISLSSYTLKEGDRGNATAVLRNASGAILTGRAVTWSSSETYVASVTATGSINAKKEGTTTITATSEGKRATATLQVVKK